MKTISYLSLLCLIFLFSSCANRDNSDVENSITKPTEIVPPNGAVFESTLFDYNFEHAQKGIDKKEYSTEYVSTAGGEKSYKLTNKKQYGIGYNNILKTTYPNHYIYLSCDVFKPKGLADPNNLKGFIIVSIHRGQDDSTVLYSTYPIYQILKGQNKQFIDKWENIAIWYKFPSNKVKVGDRIKIYSWNPNGGPIFLDNFVGELWNKKPIKPSDDYQLDHILVEQNYEEEIPGHTKETAARGIGSLIIGKKYVQFGKGYNGTLQKANAEVGDFVRITFQAHKHFKTIDGKSQAALVSSIRNEQFFYHNYLINSRIREKQKQVTQQWIPLETWFQIPEGVKGEDPFKIYSYNPYNTPIYIDDLKVEIWKKKGATQVQ